MSTRTRKRKQRAAKVKDHIRNFHSTKKQNKVEFLPLVCNGVPTKRIEDLSEYEIDQIWAEAMHYYKTEGFDPEEAIIELNKVLNADPLHKALYDRLNSLLASKNIRRDASPVTFSKN